MNDLKCVKIMLFISKLIKPTYANIELVSAITVYSHSLCIGSCILLLWPYKYMHSQPDSTITSHFTPSPPPSPSVAPLLKGQW